MKRIYNRKRYLGTKRKFRECKGLGREV